MYRQLDCRRQKFRFSLAKAELLFCCQREVCHKLNGHAVKLAVIRDLVSLEGARAQPQQQGCLFDRRMLSYALAITRAEPITRNLKPHICIELYCD